MIGLGGGWKPVASGMRGLGVGKMPEDRFPKQVAKPRVGPDQCVPPP